MYPSELKYTKEHEWIREEGGVFTVGITEYAADQLGEVTYVELPAPGLGVSADEPVATVESVKAASDVYAPVAGRVAETNSSLETQPELVNQSPYEEGWFFKLKEVDASDLRRLMDAEAYEAYVTELEQ